jgi:hypothetical protein
MADNVQSTADKTLSMLDKVQEYKVYLTMVCFALYVDIAFVTLTGRNIAEFDWPLPGGGAETSIVKLGGAALGWILYSFLMAIIFKIARIISWYGANSIWWSVTVQNLRGWAAKDQKRHEYWLHQGYVSISDVEERALNEKDSFLMSLVTSRRAEVTSSTQDLTSLSQKSFSGMVLFLIDWFLPGGESITAHLAHLAQEVKVPGFSGTAVLFDLAGFASIVAPWFYSQFWYDDSWERLVKYPPMAAEVRERQRRNREERLLREAEDRRMRLEEDARRRKQEGNDGPPFPPPPMGFTRRRPPKPSTP